MIPHRPILVYHRKEPIHFIGNCFEVRRKMVPNVYRLFAVTASKLGKAQSVYLSNDSMPFSKPISMQFDSKSYCRKRFCSWIFAKSAGLSFSRTDTGIEGPLAYRPSQICRNSLMFSDASRTLSLVISFESGALPKAKLILCSCNSSSLTNRLRFASKSFINSGSGAGTF